MSWWTKFRDTWEKGATLGAYDPERSRREQQMMKAQMEAYQQQTAMEKEQLDAARDATTAEKRRVEEKQIRAARRNYRGPSGGGTGILGVGEAASDDMSNNLGG